MLKSDNAVLNNGEAFYLPDSDNGVSALGGIAVRISHIGKSISAKHAAKYYDRYTAGISFEKICDCKDALSQSFDYSFALGNWQSLTPEENSRIAFLYTQNDNSLSVEVDIRDLFAPVIEKISQSLSLKVGDIVFIALSKETQRLGLGDKLSAELNNECVLECEIK